VSLLAGIEHKHTHTHTHTHTHAHAHTHTHAHPCMHTHPKVHLVKSFQWITNEQIIFVMWEKGSASREL
jgi:hypothetical protein